MARRLTEALLALVALIVAAPLLLVAALGVRLSSRGPVIYRSLRVGRNGGVFTMLKLRTMHVEQGDRRHRITGLQDPRVFAFGRLLRKAKLDELPQLVNVLTGRMAIVGPRPEDPMFVSRYYTELHRETLAVRPGLASPGSIYNYTHGDAVLGTDDPDGQYLVRLLPAKLGLELAYVRRRSLGYDLRIVGRTIAVIVSKMLGRRDFSDPPELAIAEREGLIEPARRLDPLPQPRPRVVLRLDHPDIAAAQAEVLP
jgi:lipopolysaccharide/colanic/teichoic acid biosynthesis glycosyltransferase